MAFPTATLEAPESLSPTIEERAVRATLTCVARHGLAKTTFDDVSREAGCARATLYRYFGGKRQLVRITIVREAARIAASIREAAATEATFEDAVVAMFVCAARELREHEALQFLFAFDLARARAIPARRPRRARRRMARPRRAHARTVAHEPDRSDRRSRDPRPRARTRAPRSASRTHHVGGTSHG